jgi:hypothetical protein
LRTKGTINKKNFKSSWRETSVGIVTQSTADNLSEIMEIRIKWANIFIEVLEKWQSIIPCLAETAFCKEGEIIAFSGE